MKKYLTAILVLSFIPHAAISSASLIHDEKYSCYVKTNNVWDAIASFFSKSTGRFFYFCGKPVETTKNKMKDKCADKTKRNKDDSKIYLNGDYFEIDGMVYQCCGGTQYKNGEFKYGAALSTTRTETKELSFGAKCNYTITTDLCGTETKTDCNTPDTCPDGQYVRNGKCITPPITLDNPQNKDADGNECAEGTYARNGECVTGTVSNNSAYESYTSNKIIVCPTTDTQGIDSNQTCTQCDPENQRWNNNIKSCINFIDMPTYSKESLRKCWQCSSITKFNQCVELFNTSSPTTHPDYKSIQTNCYIQDE